MRLKKYYSSREVASLTGLTARQLQWWDARRLFLPAIAPQRTEAGGFTERRYTHSRRAGAAGAGGPAPPRLFDPSASTAAVDAAGRFQRASLRGDRRRRAADAVYRRRSALCADDGRTAVQPRSAGAGLDDGRGGAADAPACGARETAADADINGYHGEHEDEVNHKGHQGHKENRTQRISLVLASADRENFLEVVGGPGNHVDAD